jgi:hypothetical protein
MQTFQYGDNTTILDAGQGLGVQNPLALEFSVDSVIQVAPNRVRVRYTLPANVSDATTTSSFSIPGATIVSIFNAGDPTSFDFQLAAPLVPGTYTLTVFDSISPLTGNLVLQPPYDFIFVVSQGNATGVTGGATNVSDTDLVSQYFNPAYKNKSNWQTITETLSVGDLQVAQVANNSLRQNYISTAKGAYLDKRCLEYGIKRPNKTWISDSLFSKLAVSVINQKMTEQAFLGLLEIFYGSKAVRGCISTGNKEPYSLFDGGWFRLLVDEKYLIDVICSAADFDTIRTATAQELASVITASMGDYGWAEVEKDYDSGLNFVTVYSASKGLGSSIRVVQGTLQPLLEFPTNLFPSAVAGDSWDVIRVSSTIARYGCTSTSYYNLGLVDTGDYINILDSSFSVGNRGSFVITGTVVVDGLVYVEVQNPDAVNETASPIADLGVTIFQPDKFTSYTSSNCAQVTQANGRSLVSLPVTSQIVSRNYSNAAYLRENDSIAITTLERDVTGLTTVNTGLAHGLDAGDWFEILETEVDYQEQPGVTGGTANTTTDLTSKSWISQDTERPSNYARAITDLTGNVWVVGGTNKNVDLATMGLFQVEDATIDSIGQRQNSYTWTTTTDALIQPIGSAICVMDNDDNYNQLLIVGGGSSGFHSAASYSMSAVTASYDGTNNITVAATEDCSETVTDASLTWLSNPTTVNPGGWLTGGRNATGVLDLIQVYNSGTVGQGFYHWSVMGSGSTSLIQARYQHQSIKLTNDTILIIGGRTDPTDPYDEIAEEDITAKKIGEVLNTCEIVVVEDDTLQTGSMAYARFAFGMTQLPDGRILVVGGIGYNPSKVTFDPTTKSQSECELRSVEIYDPALGTWSCLSDTLEPHSYCFCQYIESENKVFVFGGFSSLLVEYLDLTTMKWKRLPNGLTYNCVYGAGALAGTDVPLLSGGSKVSSGSYDYPVTLAGSVTLGIASYGTNSKGLNGAHQVLGVNSATELTFQSLSYYGVSTLGHTVATKAPSDSRINGPFIYDNSGVAVTETYSLTTSAIEPGTGRSIVQIASNADFPETGWVVFNFGQKNQLGPVQYYSMSAGTLNLNASFMFTEEVPIGSEVRLLYGKSVFVPETSENSAHLTTSSAGRLAAIDLLNEISACGIPLSITTRYPGDIGLGNAGQPLLGTSKISDIFEVYAGDEIDNEVKGARNGQ